MTEWAIFEILQYGFIQKAFIAGSFTAITCSSLGLFLVLRKMSLIGDGLSHVSFGAIALGLFLGVTPHLVAIPLVVLAALLILKISEKAALYGDAAIGIVSAVAIAAGVILASLGGGFNVDLFGLLFGNILAISDAETLLSAALSALVLAMIILFYWHLFSVTYDEEYARTTGINTGFINALLTVLTAVTVLLSVKVVGIMLVSALLILPAVTALQLSHRFQTALVLAAFAALLSVMIGIIVSYAADIPAGAAIVMLSALFFAVAFARKKIRF